MCLGAYRRVEVGCLQEDGGAHGERMSVYVYGGVERVLYVDADGSVGGRGGGGAYGRRK